MRTKFVINNLLQAVIKLPAPGFVKSAQLVDPNEQLKLVEETLASLRFEKQKLKPRDVRHEFDTLTGLYDFSPDSLYPAMGAWRGFEQALIEYGYELAKAARAPTTFLDNLPRGPVLMPWWVGSRKVHEEGQHPICDELFLDRPF